MHTKGFRFKEYRRVSYMILKLSRKCNQHGAITLYIYLSLGFRLNYEKVIRFQHMLLENDQFFHQAILSTILHLHVQAAELHPQPKIFNDQTLHVHVTIRQTPCNPIP